MYRSHIVLSNFLQVKLGSDKNKEMYLPNPLHPMLARAYKDLEPMFIEQVLPSSGHGLLASEDQWTALLETLPEAASKVRENVATSWSSKRSTPEKKWQELKKHLQAFLSKSSGDNRNNKVAKNMSGKERNRVENWCAEVVFRYSYPRLDVEVSKKRNHLLKSPCCVHPKTGRVCVPIQSIDDFCPFQVPTLPQLMDELDSYHQQQQENDETTSSRPEWYNTSLREYFEPFQKEFLEPLAKQVRRAKRDAEEQRAAVVGDF